MFRSDGSTAEPQLLHDVWQANASSLYYAEPGVSIGNTLFLASVADPQQDDDGRTVLWRSDGSEAGTQPLSRSVYGEGSVQRPVRFGDRIVFGARLRSASSTAFHMTDATFSTSSQLVAASYRETLQAFGMNGAGGVLMGCQLGSAFGNDNLCSVRAGESQAALIAPNLLNSGYLLPIGSSGAVALFFHRGFGSDAGLWRSDGTAPGTMRLDPDLRAVDASYGDVAAFPFQGGLLFNACNDLTGQCGLYRSDGSQAGTQFVVELPRRVLQFAALGERVALILGQSSDQQLWISDGTAAGTDLLRSFAGRSVSPMVSFGDRLHFIVSAPWPGNLPPDYYVSDGRKEGTAAVTLPAGLRPDFASLTVLDTETAAFGCHTVETGSELCAIDSDGGNPRLILDIQPGPESSRPSLVGSTSEATYYAADDGYHGFELWQVKARAERIFRDGFQ